MNRVYCLYRVSTVQQLHKDDIPMQRQENHQGVLRERNLRIQDPHSGPQSPAANQEGCQTT